MGNYQFKTDFDAENITGKYKKQNIRWRFEMGRRKMLKEIDFTFPWLVNNSQLISISLKDPL